VPILTAGDAAPLRLVKSTISTTGVVIATYTPMKRVADERPFA